MLLSYNAIVELLAQNVVEGAELANVNGTSLDIRLGEELLVEVQPAYFDSTTLSLRERETPKMERYMMDAEMGYFMKPGEFILAHSVELFNLPLDISCEFKLKSSLARMGVNQLTACWCDPGWHGSHITLELTNTLRHHNICIRPNDKIGQIVFFQHAPVPEEHSYRVRGRYNNDRTVEGVKK